MINKKLKKILICISVIALSPIITVIMYNMIPTLSISAAKLATISAEVVLCETLPKDEENLIEEIEFTSETVINEVDDSEMISVGNPNEIITEYIENEFETITENYIGPEPYPQELENESGKINSFRYYKAEGPQYISLDIAGQVRNLTKIDNSKLLDESRKLPDFKIKFNSDPQVLIMHTHTTESYEPYERDFYDDRFTSRTTEESMNVVSVGNRIEKELKSAGISVIHDRTLHDYPSYNGSYDRSEVTVKNILAEYPSIKIVLDIHRDAMENKNGERIAPVVNINDINAAQVMIISGCDNGTMNMPDYMKNFRFACLLQQQMESDYPGITRPIMFAHRKYNQHLTTGSILIEIGSHGNSIQQAQYSGKLVGKSLVNALNKIKE